MLVSDRFSAVITQEERKLYILRALKAYPLRNMALDKNNRKSLFLRTKDPSWPNKNGIMYKPSSLMYEVLETALSSVEF